MREFLALLQASWRSATSYRLNMVFSVIGMVATVIPLFFVAGAIQPIIGEAIRTEGTQYFGFLLVGITSLNFMSLAITSLAGAVAGGIATGTLEAMLTTRARPASLGAGLVSYGFTWGTIRSLLFLLAGTLLGANLLWQHVLPAAFIMLLIVLAYAGFGLVAAAMVVAFRTTGPWPQGLIMVSALLGGAYYPTHVIPSWIQELSAVIPLTYGLRAMRRVFLEGMPLTAVSGDLGVLMGMIAVFGLMGVSAITIAFRHARIRGTLAQY